MASLRDMVSRNPFNNPFYSKGGSSKRELKAAAPDTKSKVLL